MPRNKLDQRQGKEQGAGVAKRVRSVQKTCIYIYAGSTPYLPQTHRAPLEGLAAAPREGLGGWGTEAGRRLLLLRTLCHWRL